MKKNAELVMSDRQKGEHLSDTRKEMAKIMEKMIMEKNAELVMSDRQKWKHLSDTRDMMARIAERDIYQLTAIGNEVPRLQKVMNCYAQQIEFKLQCTVVNYDMAECPTSISTETYRAEMEEYKREIQMAQEKMGSIEKAYEALCKSISEYGDYLKHRNIPLTMPPFFEPKIFI